MDEEVKAALSRARPPCKTGRTNRDAILSSELDALADRVRRLLPSGQDPEALHVEWDAIERARRRLAQRAS